MTHICDWCLDGHTMREELLTRASNLERYPFESATMAEAGKLAAQHLRDAAAAIAMEARQRQDAKRLDPKDDSAGPKDIAQ